MNPRLLTLPFHLKTGTDLFTPYPLSQLYLLDKLKTWTMIGNEKLI